MLEGFCTIYKNVFSDIFFILVLSKTLRNISFRWMNKNRNLFRLGHFEQKPEVAHCGRVVVSTEGTGAYLTLGKNRSQLCRYCKRTRKNNVPSAWESLEMKTETYRRFRWAFKNDVMFSRTKKKVSLLAGLILPY